MAKVIKFNGKTYVETDNVDEVVSGEIDDDVQILDMNSICESMDSIQSIYENLSNLCDILGLGFPPEQDINHD
jgi:hypothetical protein